MARAAGPLAGAERTRHSTRPGRVLRSAAPTAAGELTREAALRALSPVGLAALLLGEGGLAGLAQLRAVLAQAGRDAATTRLHVGTEARDVRLASLARR